MPIRRVRSEYLVTGLFLFLPLPGRSVEMPRPDAAEAVAGPLPGTRLLAPEGDPTVRMVDGIAQFLERETAESVARRDHGQGAADPEEKEKELEAKRARLTRIVGAIDPLVPQPGMEKVSAFEAPERVAESDRFTAYAVRWSVLDGLESEGLLLQPKGAVIARVVAIPDADQTPEVIAGIAAGLPEERQYARRLAENGVQVVIPVLADRSDVFSGSAAANRWTNLPHREWLYRQAYITGRHVIGYEIQKIRAAVDWLSRQGKEPVGVVGWGEGGLLALYSAALEPRIDAALVSGYFSKRESLWQEPIYRNLFGLFGEFGDAEIAAMIAPRPLLIEPAFAPSISASPLPREGGRNTAAPGRIATPPLADVRAEIGRARQIAGADADAIRLCPADARANVGALEDDTLASFLAALTGQPAALRPAGQAPRELRPALDPYPRQERIVRGMERFTQRLVRLASAEREKSFWDRVAPTTPAAWHAAMGPFREKFATDVIGRLPSSDAPLNPRSRVVADRAGWTEYRIEIDVRPGVMAWGELLVPKDLAPGERRPVVVVQHGLGSGPEDTIDPNPRGKFYHQFKGLGTKLVEQGFIVLAPRNPYGPTDAFRSLQRRANPLGLSIFSFVVAEHGRMLDWLATQPCVDPQRIGFYGLSYGGKTAMRVGAIDERYAVVVCSGDFNEWIWKNASTDSPHSYLFTNEYEMPEFNLAMTFSYAEMAAMIAPRPFMVERGHDDNVSVDEWVAYEYAKVRRLYDRLGIPGRTRIEYFNGPHSIHGVGTLEFLHRFLNWPAKPFR
jgi:dienelactone hydrolase